MHAGCRAGHGVLAAGVPVVGGAGAGAGLARVCVVDVAAMGMAVVPIFEFFVGSGLLHIVRLTATGCMLSSPPVVPTAVASACVVKTTATATTVATISTTIVVV